MRPGPIPWATNDAFAAGPDIGSDTRTKPTATHEVDGFYRARRPAPDIMNYELHRMMLVQRNLARLQALNWELEDTDATGYGAAGKLISRCSGIDAFGNMEQYLFFWNSVTGFVVEYHTLGHRIWSVPASSPVIGGAPVAVGAADSDEDDLGRRIITYDDAINADIVLYYDTGAGAPAWTTITWLPGAPTVFWHAVGCDRLASPRWLIGGATGAGAPRCYTSTDGINFSAVAAFPVLVTDDIRAIGHTLHAAGALGPDDAGNPGWLVMTDTFAARSANGTTGWSAAAHGLALGGGTLGPKSIAYSRTSGRWVAVLPAATGGDVAYSDDNGATWTTISSAISLAGTDEPSIACDGHGTFVISAGNARFYASTDEGLTWCQAYVPATDPSIVTANLDGAVLDFIGERSVNVDDESEYPSRFSLAIYDGTTTEAEIFSSLLV